MTNIEKIIENFPSDMAMKITEIILNKEPNWSLRLEKALTQIRQETIDEILEIIKSNIVENAQVFVETPEYKFARKLVNAKLNNIIKLIQSKKETL